KPGLSSSSSLWASLRSQCLPLPWSRKPTARRSTCRKPSLSSSGFHTEYSGFRWSLFFLAEYAAMLAVSSIAVTLWLGGWMRPFPNLLGGPTWELAFSFVPALAFFVLAGLCLLGTIRMPKIPQMRIQTIGLGAFGALLGFVGLVLLIPGVRERVQDIFWFVAKVAFFMYLYIWYRG